MRLWARQGRGAVSTALSATRPLREQRQQLQVHVTVFSCFLYLRFQSLFRVHDPFGEKILHRNRLDNKFLSGERKSRFALPRTNKKKLNENENPCQCAREKRAASQSQRSTQDVPVTSHHENAKHKNNNEGAKEEKRQLYSLLMTSFNFVGVTWSALR